MIYTRDTLWVNVPRNWWELGHTSSVLAEYNESWSFKDMSCLIFTDKNEAEHHCKVGEVTVTLEERENRELDGAL